MSDLEAAEARRLEEAQENSRVRCQAFIAALPPSVQEWDKRIEAQLVRDNASLKSKLGKVYRLIDAVSLAAEPFVACKKGCSSCCKMNVSITSLEAELLAAASGRRQARVSEPIPHGLGEFSGVPCPFLVDDACSVYGVRPFACRAHRSFDIDAYWCHPGRDLEGEMAMLTVEGAETAYMTIASQTKAGGFAEIRDFFPPAI